MARCVDLEAMAAEGLVSHEFYAAYHQWHRDRIQLRQDPPSAAEISAMERAIGWPGRYLRDRLADEVRALNLVGLARARDVELKDVVHHGRHAGVRSTTVWQELALEAATQIARGLRADCVAVF